MERNRVRNVWRNKADQPVYNRHTQKKLTHKKEMMGIYGLQLHSEEIKARQCTIIVLLLIILMAFIVYRVTIY